MTIRLNLIGSKIQHEINQITNYITAINNLVLLSIAIGLVSLLTFVGHTYLKSSVDDLDHIKVQTPLDQEILTINTTIQQVETIQKDYVKWSRVLNNITALIPEGNHIQNINIDKTNNKLTISGNANTRDNFLKLKQNLENFDLIAQVDSPISNLLHQVNINFTLEAELKLD